MVTSTSTSTSTSRSLDPKVVASRCLAAWSSGDFDGARALLDEHVQFTGPLGHTEGVDAYIEGVRGFAKSVKRIDERRVFGDGDDVCIIYDLLTTSSPEAVPTAAWYRVRHGRVIAVNAFFDARPLTGGRPGSLR
jgi:hypothetical protein